MSKVHKNTKTNAIELLKQDHKTVKGLFDQFEEADKLAEKKKIVAQAINALKIHASIEEEIFYPNVFKAVGKDLMTEADEEHHVAKILIAELEAMDGSEDHYDAKFTVLSENIRHHIKEEEGEMFKKAASFKMDMDALGEKMIARKEELEKNGVDESLEEKMIAVVKGKNDSSAMAAKKYKVA